MCDWKDENHFKVGDRVFFDYPHNDFPRGPVTIITMPEWVRWYSWVHVRSDDGQDYKLAQYGELRPLSGTSAAHPAPTAPEVTEEAGA